MVEAGTNYFTDYDSHLDSLRLYMVETLEILVGQCRIIRRGDDGWQVTLGHRW